MEIRERLEIVLNESVPSLSIVSKWIKLSWPCKCRKGSPHCISIKAVTSQKIQATVVV